VPVFVGTSGWQYPDWRGVLYPQSVPQRSWLPHYANRFDTVECNNAFYRLPSAETFTGWREATPTGFVMALKASRFLTHIKRLRDPAEPVQRLVEHAAGLGDRLGPVLLQLPPTLGVQPRRLDDCLACFPAGVRVAVEPRHDSWYNDEIREVLATHGAALCWADRLGHPATPLWRTAEWGYLRFHVGAARPWPRYGRQALRTWVNRIAATWDAGADVFVYFNNDPGAAAVRDAVAFARISTHAGLPTSHVPDLAPVG
jgi:uncharacterized protein YecE (DUF72 family)